MKQWVGRSGRWLGVAFGVILCGFIASQVVEAKGTKEALAKEFFPLLDGAEWHYQVERKVGKITSSFAYRVKCEKEGKLFVLKTRLATGRRRKEILQREYLELSKTGDVLCGVRENGPIRVPLKPAQVLLKGQMKEGQSWSWTGTYKGRKASSQYKVLGFETITVGTTKFRCLKLSLKTQTVKPASKQLRTFWYAPKVGLVREQSKETGSVEVIVTADLAFVTGLPGGVVKTTKTPEKVKKAGEKSSAASGSSKKGS